MSSLFFCLYVLVFYFESPCNKCVQLLCFVHTRFGMLPWMHTVVGGWEQNETKSWYSCEWSRKLITKSFNQVFNVMWKPSLISPWQQTGKHKELKNIMFSHLTVNCSLLRANWISSQVLQHVVDLRGYCYCFSVPHRNPSTSKLPC